MGIIGRFELRGRITMYETKTHRVTFGKLPSGQFYLVGQNKRTGFKVKTHMPNRRATLAFTESYLLNA